MIAYTDIGEPDFPCILFFHGAPAGRLRLPYLEHHFLAEGVRVVSPLADGLGIEHFVVAGHSSGGPYGLACAAGLPERVSAAIVLGGATDMGWPGAWNGYLESEAELMRQPDERAAIDWCTKRFGSDGSGFMAVSGFEIPEPNQRLYTDETVARLLAAARADAFRHGVLGYAQDIFIQGRPWPFDPGSISSPVHVVHGGADTLLPAAHSRHTAELIPGAVLPVPPPPATDTSRSWEICLGWLHVWCVR